MKDIFLLDMDETLLDFSRAEEVNFFGTMERFGLRADAEVYARFHTINDDLWKLLERGGITRDEIKVQRFQRLFEEYGYAADAEAVAGAYFENFCNLCFPFEGAIELLATLKARGRVYIVTNGGAVIQKAHIRDAGFAPYLDGVFISEEVGFNKPSKEYADFVKAHIPDFAEARAMWLGDSLTSDMVCAKRANVDFILYAPAGVLSERVATNYAEVLRILETL